MKLKPHKYKYLVGTPDVSRRVQKNPSVRVAQLRF